MWQEVEFLVTKYRLDATIVRCILKKKFLSHSLFSKDLYVEIQRYRPSNNEDETNILTNLFWISPEQILLWYEFGESIGHNNTAGTNRYNMPLSLFVAQDDNMQSPFTLGIQSMSFIKSQNACIKRVLESSNTSLCTPSSTNIVTIFPTIESLVKRYLRPNVSHFLIEQMKESLYYMASHSTVEEVKLLIICESSQSKDMKGELDAVNLSAKYLLDRLERNTIEEIWKLSRVTSSKINHFVFLLSNSSYSCTCLLQQKKGLRWIPRDQRLGIAKEGIYFGQRFGNVITNIDTAPKNIEGRFVWLQPFNNNETGETTNEGYINKILFYEKVWGLARTAINKYMLHCDHEFVCLIEEYLSRIHIREDELIGEQETSTHTSFNRHTIEDIPLANLRKVTVKGRPKAASHKNAAKITLQDTGNKKKHGQYTCGFCKELGHNVATCPNKVE
ncbi:22044_t:CDS:2, partial [Racocetra persica]